MSNLGLNRPLPLNNIEESSGSYMRACKFYEIPSKADKIATYTSHRSNIPIITSFEDLAYLSTVFATALSTSDKPSTLERTFIQILDLLSSMATRLTDAVNVSWDPRTWSGAILALLQSVSFFFSLVSS